MFNAHRISLLQNGKSSGLEDVGSYETWKCVIPPNAERVQMVNVMRILLQLKIIFKK